MGNEREVTKAPESKGVAFRPSLGAAIIIILYLVFSMSAAIFLLKEKMHVTMLSSLGVTILVLVIEKCPWSKIEDAIVHGGKLMIPTALILYGIGALMGAWIASGTVPMIIYWGLKLVSPSMFLVTACLACIITSMSTGSSWSAIGTAGAALMGVAFGLGINPAMTAGAIVSGAAFGDKMSPLSDTTNSAPAVAEGDLFDHIILEVCLEKMKFVGTLVCSTVIGCIIFNMVTASQYVSIILGGRLFIGEYKKKGLLPQVLSRTLEDAGTVTFLIVPWNVDGAFAAATLGVSAGAFLPFAVFNWVVPVIAIIFGITNKLQWKTEEIPSTRTYRTET